MSGKKWSKKKENYNNKQYFDPQRITTILDKTHAKDYDIGLSLTEKYICDYPNDPIGYLSKARLLILTGNIEEGESLADSTFFMGSYHDDSARVNGAMIYGSILQILGKYDEALNIYQEAITNYRVTDNPEKYLAFLDEYIEFLHRQNKNDEIIEFVRLNPKINENSKYVVKVGQAYYKKRDYSTAINILKKVKCDDRVESQRCFYLGISYYQQYLIHKNESDLLEAKKILLQSLSQKSPRYYISCYTLAQIYRLMDNELKALEYIKYAISSYNLMMADSSARIADFYTIECQIYLDVGDYDKFFESLNMIEDEYSKKRLLMRYYCNTRQYEECIKTCEYLLGVDISDKAEDKQDDNVRVALYHLLCSFIRLGEYEKADYYLRYVKDELTDGDADKFRTIIDISTNQVPREGLTYTSRQIINYDKEELIKHVCDGHLNSIFENFKSREAIEEAYNYVKDNIDNYKSVPKGILDEVHIPCSKYFESGDADTLVAIIVPGTNNIITMYPVTCRDHSNSNNNEAPKKLLVRESAIDKFNRKYGLTK